MAISPPSDIVLDVARAVEPAGLETARARLSARSAATAASFEFDGALSLSGTSSPNTLRAAREPDSFQRFEAMVLQTFLQNMMPKDAESAYGKGMAGDMWKAMMAEKLAGVVSERGGIGIADRLLRDHYVVDDRKIPVGAVSDMESSIDADRQASLSTAMIQEMQRKLAHSLAEDKSVAEAFSF